MKLLLDSDVLLDIGLNRAPFFEASNAVVRECQQRQHLAVVAWHTLANAYYMLRSPRGEPEARQFIAELIRFCEVARCSTEAVRHALTFHISDFEDALQVSAGLAESSQFIITRNLQHFRNSPLPPLTPSQFLARFPNP